MTEKRPSNSEKRLLEVEAEESRREEELGILEIFDQDEDAPISRDDPEVAASV